MRRDEGSNPSPVTNEANMDNTLGEFDRTRIDRDLEQLKELIERKEYVLANTTDTQRRAELANELDAHKALLTQTKALIQ